jgi:hypothetical protein
MLERLRILEVENGVRPDEVVIEVVDLPGSVLAASGQNRILLDHSAAGYGWFIDTSPHDDAEFSGDSDAVSRRASPLSPAAARIDLLTVLAHELQHLTGSRHSEDVDNLMSGTLESGTRHRLDPLAADEILECWD